jgi:hypothetical protein
MDAHQSPIRRPAWSQPRLRPGLALAADEGDKVAGGGEGALVVDDGLNVLADVPGDVTCVRPASMPPVIIRDAAVAAGYVASLADHHQAPASPATARRCGAGSEQAQRAVVGAAHGYHRGRHGYQVSVDGDHWSPSAPIPSPESLFHQ